MKRITHTLLISALMVATLTGCGGNKEQNDKQDTTMNTELKPFDVQKDFADNGFTHEALS